MALQLLAPSPELVQSGYTTPNGPRPSRCPDAPRGVHRHIPYNSPRRGQALSQPEPRHRSHSQAPDTSMPRQIRPTPAILAFSVFTSLAFAEAAAQGHHRRQASQGARELLGLEPSALELERRLGEVFQDSRRSSFSSGPQSPQEMNQVETYSPEDPGTEAIEEDSNPDHSSTPPPPPPYRTEPTHRETDGDPITPPPPYRT